MKATGNLSDTNFERLQSISIIRVMNPSDAVDLESLL